MMNSAGGPYSYARRSVGSFVTIVVSVLVGLGVFWAMRTPKPAAPQPTTVPAAASQPVAIALITQEARELKLLTWTFETTVDAQTVSDKWYGDAVANVRAPVRYQYGVDLESLAENAVRRDAVTGELLFLVKPPERLAVEIDLERLEASLKTSGLRWRSRNQQQLDDTRAKLGAAAKGLALSKKDENRMRDVSRQQIEKHLRTVLSRIDPGATVSVKFTD